MYHKTRLDSLRNRLIDTPISLIHFFDTAYWQMFWQLLTAHTVNNIGPLNSIIENSTFPASCPLTPGTLHAVNASPRRRWGLDRALRCWISSTRSCLFSVTVCACSICDHPRWMSKTRPLFCMFVLRAKSRTNSELRRVSSQRRQRWHRLRSSRMGGPMHTVVSSHFHLYRELCEQWNDH